MYCFSIMFAKLSILLFFMKIFVPTRRGGVFWVNQVLIYINALLYIGSVVALLCQCIPRAKISNPTLPGRCTNVRLSVMISAVLNVVSDFFILVLPLWAIWHLQMPLKRKFGVSIVFATGVLYVLPPPSHRHLSWCLALLTITFFFPSALLSSIMRVYYSSQFASNQDRTFIRAKIALWTYVFSSGVLLLIEMKLISHD